MKSRAEACEVVGSFVAHRLAHKGKLNVETEGELADIIAKLGRCCPVADKDHVLLRELYDIKDKNVFKKLQILVDPSSSYADIRLATDDVLKKCGSETSLSKYLKVMIPSFSFTFLG